MHLFPGGSGKTTLAMQLYNLLAAGTKDAPGFKHKAFITLDPADSGEAKMRDHIIRALRQLGASGFNEAADAAELGSYMTTFARDHAILLVVDNVWTQEQADALLLSELGPGSRVIVTSRYVAIPGSTVLQVRGFVAELLA